MYTNETSPTSPGFPPPFQDVQWPGDLGQDLLPIATQIQSKSVTSVLNRTSLPVGIPSMVSDSWGSGWAYGGAGNTHAWAGSSSGLLPLPPPRFGWEGNHPRQGWPHSPIPPATGAVLRPAAKDRESVSLEKPRDRALNKNGASEEWIIDITPG